VVAHRGKLGGFAALADRGQEHWDHRAAAGWCLDHRVEHGAHREAGLGDGPHDAVDQEGAVGLHDLEQVAFEVGPVGTQGAADPDRQRLCGISGLAEAPEADQGLGDVGRLEAWQFLGRPVFLGLGRELLQGLGKTQPLLAGSRLESGRQRAGLAGAGLGVKFFAAHGISSSIFSDNLAFSGLSSTLASQK